jgi:hypothetical protein
MKEAPMITTLYGRSFEDIRELIALHEGKYGAGAPASVGRGNDWPECEDFYNLMQVYRHTPLWDVRAVKEAYEKVKEWLRGHPNSYFMPRGKEME